MYYAFDLFLPKVYREKFHNLLCSITWNVGNTFANKNKNSNLLNYHKIFFLKICIAYSADVTGFMKLSKSYKQLEIQISLEMKVKRVACSFNSNYSLGLLLDGQLSTIWKFGSISVQVGQSYLKINTCRC